MNPASNKHVLMVLDREFPPDIRVENEIDILLSSGIRVSILAMTRKGLARAETTSNGLTIFRAPISDLTYKASVACLKFPTYFSFWRAAIGSVARDTNFDAIHVHDLPLAKVGREFATAAGIPLVLDLHENWPYMLDDAQHTNTFLGRLLSRPAQWRKYEEEMTRAADAVITVVDEMRGRVIALHESGAPISSDVLQAERARQSDGAKETSRTIPAIEADKKPGTKAELIQTPAAQATSAHDTFGERVFVYQNVPDLALQDVIQPKTQSDRFNLFYAGGITKQRGLQVVMDAIAIGRENSSALRNLRFSVLGDGRYLDTLKQQVGRLDIENQVEFAGWQTQDEVMRALSTADLAIVPHIRSVQNDNSSPNKIFQYMLSETAVITSDCRSLQRVVEETKSGLTYRHDSPEDLATKLDWAVNNRSRLTGMADNGKRAVLQRYNKDVEKKGIEQVYEYLGLL